MIRHTIGQGKLWKLLGLFSQLLRTEREAHSRPLHYTHSLVKGNKKTLYIQSQEFIANLINILTI